MRAASPGQGQGRVRVAGAGTGGGMNTSNPKRPEPHDLPAGLDRLPPGQRRVAVALVETGTAQSYPAVAAALGVHLGTVHRHLGRVRARHPALYAALMAERARQLATRHTAALARAAAHSEQWHRRQANRRYYYRYGRWPWERRG
jgi:hypothetical protein